MPPVDFRLDAIRNATTVVVKVGTRVLTDGSGRLDNHRIENLSAGLCAIADTGRQTIMVSSGAVGAGVGKLGLAERPAGLAQLQAIAAVGQTDLIQAYEAALSRGGRHAAQVLLTRSDLRRRSGYLNVRNALSRIHDFGAIAVVNENDSVAVAELMTTFGDNDGLAAQVAGLFGDALLVILSDVDGLYDGPPESETSRKLDLVESLEQRVFEMAQSHQSINSKGGMASKLGAAQLATSHGQAVIIGPGRVDDVLQRILRAETIGTLFLPSERSIRGRRRWIGASAELEGCLVVDDGAVRALCANGRSLLAIGITAVRGDFGAGAAVSIEDPHGTEIARGLCNYPSNEVLKILRQPSESIADVLGRRPYDSVVHRDNLTLQSPEFGE